VGKNLISSLQVILREFILPSISSGPTSAADVLIVYYVQWSEYCDRNGDQNPRNDAKITSASFISFRVSALRFLFFKYYCLTRILGF
jgi:hypothetical protein